MGPDHQAGNPYLRRYRQWGQIINTEDCPSDSRHSGDHVTPNLPHIQGGVGNPFSLRNSTLKSLEA